MSGVNKAIVVGNLGRDPEMRATQSGMEVCNFSVATSDKRGEEERTEWHNIVVFGKAAVACDKYLRKGSQCYVEGRIQTRKWQGRNGEERYTTEIVADSVQFLGGRQRSDEKDDLPW